MAERELVTFDWAIKRLLRSKANFAVLEGFLSELLREEITIQAVLESESNLEDAADKGTRVDLLVFDQQRRNIIIEVQYEHEGDYFHRICFGASKALVESIEAGHRYGEIKRVISVSILHFNLGQGLDYIYEGRTEFRGMHHKDLLALSAEQEKLYQCKQVSDIFPEYYLLKVNSFDQVARDGLDQWIYFLKTGTIERGFDAKGLPEAKEALDVLRLSPAERRAYDNFIKERRIAMGVATSTVFLKEEMERIEAEMKVKLEESNQKLEESHQKLEATNQQLETKAQQLEATNQQLEAERVQRLEAQRHAEAAQRQKAVMIGLLVAKGMPEDDVRRMLAEQA